MLAAIIAALLSAGPASPQPAQDAPTARSASSAQPRAAAFELAALIAPPTTFFVGGEDEGAIASAMEREFLSTMAVSRGPSCDPKHPACAAAARSLARELAPVRTRYIREVVRSFYAYEIQDLLSDVEIREAIRFLKTQTGSHLATAVRNLGNPYSGSQQSQILLYRIMSEKPDPTAKALDMFYDRTADLPRAPMRMVPRPPMVPPQP